MQFFILKVYLKVRSPEVLFRMHKNPAWLIHGVCGIPCRRVDWSPAWSSPHLCPGAWISHQEAVVGSRILLQRMKNPRIVEEKMPKDIDGVSPAPMGIVSVRELWLEFDREA